MKSINTIKSLGMSKLVSVSTEKLLRRRGNKQERLGDKNQIFIGTILQHAERKKSSLCTFRMKTKLMRDVSGRWLKSAGEEPSVLGRRNKAD